MPYLRIVDDRTYAESSNYDQFVETMFSIILFIFLVNCFFIVQY